MVTLAVSKSSFLRLWIVIVESYCTCILGQLSLSMVSTTSVAVVAPYTAVDVYLTGTDGSLGRTVVGVTPARRS